ncbi:175_t:CDS:2 [Dentiscutata erythropus]|uniref:175_t:CDS:1 n=1 Tax=Dentiscutata erythropus TaxID=1348616 RepID=A0A9N8WKN5_9GLOM|nr:175_t:CDS:2 [Dentiscutata erythropus]
MSLSLVIVDGYKSFFGCPFASISYPSNLKALSYRSNSLCIFNQSDELPTPIVRSSA